MLPHRGLPKRQAPMLAAGVPSPVEPIAAILYTESVIETYVRDGVVTHAVLVGEERSER